MNVTLEKKGWGEVRHVFDSPACAVSILYVEAGGYCSRHWHRERVNRFIVVSGSVDVVEYANGNEDSERARRRLRPGDVHDVPAGIVHRFEVVESGIVVEVYWPATSVRLDDIVRLDVGGRR